MKNNALQYTFKVWVTSVLVSPILFSLILLIRQVVTINELWGYGCRLVQMYVELVVLQFLFSFITWLVFLLLINIVSFINPPLIIVKPIIFGIGVMLTIATFMALYVIISLTGDQDKLINLMYANCIGIGWGVWYYQLTTERLTLLK